MKTEKAKILSLLLASALALPAPLSADGPVKKNKAPLYVEISDHVVFYEATNLLRLDRLYRKLFNKKVRAQDVNVYDEVPDSSFFTNRHARTRLSAEELTKGSSVNDGPSPDGELTIVTGKTEGLHPGFFMKDTRGDKYMFKFDTAANLELNTSAEVISSRFFHAIGYNVPQYTIYTFAPERLVPGPEARVRARNGFLEKLTPGRLSELLIPLPLTEEGHLRASASKFISGENKGVFNFEGRRKDDPADTIDHEHMRAVRALAVFGSWLNNNDLRRGNTLDMWVTENGKSYLKHYLIDFNSTLGGAAGGAKPPMFTHEYFVDYGEAVKYFLGFGFYKGDWQKRWDEAGRKENPSPAQGYLDNRYFYPEKFKLQFPNYAQKDVTRADGFWAAKIMMNFTDEDVRAMVKAGRYSNPEDEKFVTDILIERRDAIAKYLFSQASPLDGFELGNGKLAFTDLETKHGFIPAEGTVYSLDAVSGQSGRDGSLGRLESAAPEFDIPSSWQNDTPTAMILRVKRPSETEERPYVLVEIHGDKITRILHQD